MVVAVMSRPDVVVIAMISDQGSESERNHAWTVIWWDNDAARAVASHCAATGVLPGR